MSRQDADAAEASSHAVMAEIATRRLRPPAARDMVLTSAERDELVRALDMIRSTMRRVTDSRSLSETERRACLKAQAQAVIMIDRHMGDLALQAHVVMALRNDFFQALTLLEQIGQRYGHRLQRGDRQILDMVRGTITEARDIVLMVRVAAEAEAPDARSAS